MTLVMGIVNVTPDSFSDGGNYETVAAAVSHGLELMNQGAAILDIGGESTRPGAQRVPAEVEADRVLPVIKALVAQGAWVSVDTMRASVAAAAIEAGATIVNDVSGGLADPELPKLVAQAEVDYVIMHWRGHSAQMQQAAKYDDVLTEVITELSRSRDAALAAGVKPERIILDPGIGFAKTSQQNWTLLAGLERFNELGHRVLVGASRKRFLGELLGYGEPQDRDSATAAVSSWCALAGIWGVRSHEVTSQLDAIKVAQRLRQG